MIRNQYLRQPIIIKRIIIKFQSKFRMKQQLNQHQAHGTDEKQKPNVTETEIASQQEPQMTFSQEAPLNHTLEGAIRRQSNLIQTIKVLQEKLKKQKGKEKENQRKAQEQNEMHLREIQQMKTEHQIQKDLLERDLEGFKSDMMSMREKQEQSSLNETNLQLSNRKLQKELEGLKRQLTFFSQFNHLIQQVEGLNSDNNQQIARFALKNSSQIIVILTQLSFLTKKLDSQKKIQKKETNKVD